MQDAWNNFKDIKVRCSLNPVLDSWEDVMLGEIPQPHNVVIEEEFEWEVSKLCNINENFVGYSQVFITLVHLVPKM
jgi:hypothetical protein